MPQQKLLNLSADQRWDLDDFEFHRDAPEGMLHEALQALTVEEQTLGYIIRGFNFSPAPGTSLNLRLADEFGAAMDSNGHLIIRPTTGGTEDFAMPASEPTIYAHLYEKRIDSDTASRRKYDTGSSVEVAFSPDTRITRSYGVYTNTSGFVDSADPSDSDDPGTHNMIKLGICATDGSDILSWDPEPNYAWFHTGEVTIGDGVTSFGQHNGADETPFQTILIAALNAGVQPKIFVKPGTYTFANELNITQADVRIIGAGSDLVTIDGSPGAGANSLIQLTATADRAQISGLRLEGDSNDSLFIEADDCVIDDIILVPDTDGRLNISGAGNLVKNSNFTMSGTGDFVISGNNNKIIDTDADLSTVSTDFLMSGDDNEITGGTWGGSGGTNTWAFTGERNKLKGVTTTVRSVVGNITVNTEGDGTEFIDCTIALASGVGDFFVEAEDVLVDRCTVNLDGQQIQVGSTTRNIQSKNFVMRHSTINQVAEAQSLGLGPRDSLNNDDSDPAFGAYRIEHCFFNTTGDGAAGPDFEQILCESAFTHIIGNRFFYDNTLAGAIRFCLKVAALEGTLGDFVTVLGCVVASNFFDSAQAIANNGGAVELSAVGTGIDKWRLDGLVLTGNTCGPGFRASPGAGRALFYFVSAPAPGEAQIADGTSTGNFFPSVRYELAGAGGTESILDNSHMANMHDSGATYAGGASTTQNSCRAVQDARNWDGAVATADDDFINH